MTTNRNRRERYADRQDAGRTLAAELGSYGGRPDVLVLGLPRGGVPVAAVIAESLEAPLDVVLVRKIGVPGHQEVAMGAMASVAGSIDTVRNEDVLAKFAKRYGDPGAFDQVAAKERAELDRRERVYRAGRPPLDVAGRTLIVVDDGLATGATMRAAITVLRELSPARIVAAVPVGLSGTCREVGKIADEVVCPWNPQDFVAVGQAYDRFDQVDDAEVINLLAKFQRPAQAG